MTDVVCMRDSCFYNDHMNCVRRQIILIYTECETTEMAYCSDYIEREGALECLKST
jgi:hypothetical protein